MFCLFGAHGSFQEHDDLHHEPDDDAFQHFKHHNRAGGRQDHRDHGCPSGREVQELPDLGFSVLDGSYPPQDPWFSDVFSTFGLSKRALDHLMAS